MGLDLVQRVSGPGLARRTARGGGEALGEWRRSSARPVQSRHGETVPRQAGGSSGAPEASDRSFARDRLVASPCPTLSHLGRDAPVMSRRLANTFDGTNGTYGTSPFKV